MQIKYSFQINGTTVYPIYKDDISKEYQMEKDQRFYRSSLSNSLVFTLNDFNFINNQPFETEFELLIKKSNNGGLSWENYYTGVFYKTDCEIDNDNEKIKVEINQKDQYTETLSKIEEEYDLIKLNTPKTPVIIQKRPLIQLYKPGDNVVNCFLGGSSWEQDVTELTTDTNKITNDYGFSLASTFYKWGVLEQGFFNGVQDNLLGDYIKNEVGLYLGRNDIFGIKESWYGNTVRYTIHDPSEPKSYKDLGSIYTDSNGRKWVLGSAPSAIMRVMAYKHTYSLPSPSGVLTWVSGGINENNINYTINSDDSGGYWTLTIYNPINSIVYFKSLGHDNQAEYGNYYYLVAYHDNAQGYLFATYENPIEIYGRLLVDVTSIQGVSTFIIPSNDLVADNRNYQRGIGYAYDCVNIHNFASINATKYGLSTDGLYFEVPNSPSENFYPILKSTWEYSSFWLALNQTGQEIEIEGRKSYTMSDSILLSDAIKTLLNEIDPTISHEGTSEYSEFLYGDINPITYSAFKVMITQKSNILAGEYSQPAQKAPISLKDILNMLKNVFQCYWCIIDNKLIIEHVTWFKAGGVYSPTPLVSYDTTTKICAKNGKPWSFGLNVYGYDKFDMPERYEFTWMDDVTEGFSGYPIRINSKFVNRGKKEEINVAQFTSDVDYMLVNSEAFGSDGFALLAVVSSNLFDIDDVDNLLGYILNLSGGSVSYNSSYNTSDYIEVKASKNYFSNSAKRIAFYDSLKNWISSINLIAGQEQIFTTPANTSYVRVSTEAVNWSTLHITEGSSFVKWKLPYIQRLVDGASLLLQNGYVSWIYLHPNYWVWDLPSDNVTINEAEYSWVYGVDRRKSQKIRIPLLDDPDPMQLIKTELGYGQIDKISINLQSRMSEIQLKYDTLDL